VAGNCGASGVSNLTLNLSDTGSATTPESSCSSSATYKPYADVNYLGTSCPTFPGATPSSPACANGSTIGFNTTFQGLTGAGLNGTWNVYAEIFDDSEAAGSIASINLTITTEVSESATTTSVSVNPGEVFNSSPNNTATFTATVTSGANNVNEGSVQFYDNGTAAGTPAAVSGGIAQLNDIYSPGTAEGLHKITAVYTDTASNPKYRPATAIRILRTCSLTTTPRSAMAGTRSAIAARLRLRATGRPAPIRSTSS
jgi:hypothetical protein